MEDYQLPKGAEPCWTTCWAEVNVRYVQYCKIIVSPSTTVCGAAPLLLRPAPAVCASAAFLPRSRHHLALDLCCCHLSLLLLFVTLRRVHLVTETDDSCTSGGHTHQPTPCQHRSCSSSSSNSSMSNRSSCSN